MIALIDADIIVYKAAIVAEWKADWDGDGDVTETYNAPQAFDVARTLVNSWTKAAVCESPLLAFSDRTRDKMSFRYRLYPDYKVHRPHERPYLHDQVVGYLKDAYRWVGFAGLEGDDTMGILATGPGGDNYVIVSIDKDMKTLPCWRVNPDDKDRQVQKFNEFTADYHWMIQTLTGDPVDNFKGCPMIGPVKAQQYLAMSRSLGEMWDRVRAAYLAAYGRDSTRHRFDDITPYDMALMNARCARILRYEDYKDGMVRLWDPDNADVWMPAVMNTEPKGGTA